MIVNDFSSVRCHHAPRALPDIIQGIPEGLQGLTTLNSSTQDEVRGKSGEAAWLVSVHVKLSDPKLHPHALRNGELWPACKACSKVDRILANNVVYEKEKGERPEELQCAIKAIVHARIPVCLHEQEYVLRNRFHLPLAIRKIYDSMRNKTAMPRACSCANPIHVQMILLLFLREHCPMVVAR